MPYLKKRSKNSRLGITGFLAYRSGNFIQYIEGDDEPLRNLYATICADPRHGQILILDEGEIPERQFGDWAMNLRTFSGSALFSESELAHDAIGIKRIISDFVANMR